MDLVSFWFNFYFSLWIPESRGRRARGEVVAGQEGIGLVMVGFGFGLVCPKALKRCDVRGGQRWAGVLMPP